MVEFEGSINVIDDIKTDLRTDHLLEPSEEILHKNLRKSLQDHQEILHQMDSEDKLSISNVSTSGTGFLREILRTVDERATRTSDTVSESHQGMCIDNKNHLQGLSNQNADPAELHNMIAKVFSDNHIRLTETVTETVSVRLSQSVLP